MTHTIPPKLTENQPQVQVPAPPQRVRQKPRALWLLAVPVLVGGLGYLGWRNQPVETENQLELSGRIEGYETEIGVKRTGRIESIAVEEGDRVKKGQELIKLDPTDDQMLQQQVLSAEARIESARFEEQQAVSEIERVQSEIEQIEQQINEAKLNWQQSKGDARGRIEEAVPKVAAVRAQVLQAEAEAEQAAAELNLATAERSRYAKLLNEGAITQQQFDRTQTAFETAAATLKARQAAVNAAREQLSVAEGGLLQAKTTGFNPSIRNAQLEALIRKKDQSYAQLKSAQSKVKSARAKVKDTLAAKQEILTQIEDAKKDWKVVSPLDGVVTARNVELGAVVNSQTKLLTILDPKRVYLRGFIPEGELGKLRLGQAVRIFLDSAPKQPLSGQIVSIDPQASFTPENIYFRQDRVKQVFGLRISITQPSGCLNPNQPYGMADLPCPKIGMPADAEIRLN